MRVGVSIQIARVVVERTRVREQRGEKGNVPLRKKVAGNVGNAAKFLSVVTVEVITTVKKCMNWTTTAKGGEGSMGVER